MIFIICQTTEHNKPQLGATGHELAAYNLCMGSSNPQLNRNPCQSGIEKSEWRNFYVLLTMVRKQDHKHIW